jgi:hypothetical protein
METSAVPDQEHIHQLVEKLESCLRDLDEVDASIAAAHLVSALAAFRRQFNLSSNPSDTD